MDPLKGFFCKYATAVVAGLIVFAMISTAPCALASGKDKGKGHGQASMRDRRDDNGYQNRHMEKERETHRRYDGENRAYHEQRRDVDDRGYDRPRERHHYHDYRGYRERPHDRGRHYGHYKHNGHRYEYDGHWRSWDEWDRYAKRNPDIYRHGHYYRDNTHLMFRFCEPGSGACYFFSIGR